MNLVGQRVGKIRILDHLGEGGMGQVYVGYDEKLERKVAVKVLHGGQRLDKEAKERFVREAKVLSQLEHPNICRIYDFVEDFIDGEDHDFLIMELIQGKELAETGELPWKTKMHIAEQVAEVLSVAHRRHIVHRDLKPDNVMINDEGRVKVLDFGLARAFDDHVGPAEPQPTSTDDVAEDIVVEIGGRVVKVQAPIVLEGGGFRTEHGAIRGTPLYMSPEQARGESVTAASDMYSFGLLLQWLFSGKSPYPRGLTSTGLIIRAMKGDTEQVSGVDASVASLIKDLKSVTPENRPVAQDVLNRIKWIRKKPVRRMRAIALAAFIFVLILGIAVSTIGFVKARRSEIKATEEADNAKQTITLLQEFLASVAPGEKGKDLKVRELLEAFKPRLAELEDKPLIQARLYFTYAYTYQSLGMAEEALVFADNCLEIRKKVLGEEHLDTAKALNINGALLHLTGNPKRARPYLEKSLAIRKNILGDGHPDTAFSLNSMGILLLRQGDLEGARPYLEQALAIRKKALGMEHRDTARSLTNLGNLMSKMGDLKGSRKLQEQALEIQKKILGEEHPSTAGNLVNLGALSSEMGDMDGARAYFEEALAIKKRVLGEDHPDTASTLDNLGIVLQRSGKLDAALPYYEQSLRIRKKVLGEEHPQTAWSMNGMGVLLVRMGDLEAARPYIEQGLRIHREVLGEDHPSTAWCLVSMGDLMDKMGDLPKARAHFEKVLEIHRDVYGDDHNYTYLAMTMLAGVLEQQGKLEQAVALYSQAAKGGHKDAQDAMKRLGKEW